MQDSCSFAKTILHGSYACSKSCAFYIGERHGMSCTDLIKSERCQQVLADVFTICRFTLKSAKNLPAVKHATKLQLQIALFAVLNHDNMMRDIDELLTERYTKNSLPIKDILKMVNSLTPRGKRKHNL